MAQVWLHVCPLIYQARSSQSGVNVLVHDVCLVWVQHALIALHANKYPLV